MKIKLLLLLTLFGFAASAQTKYELNFDSVRVGKVTIGAVRLSGKVYMSNLTSGLITDSVIVFRNNRVFKVPRSQFLSSYTETDPTTPAYAKTLTGFPVIKASTDPLYKAIGYTPSNSEIISGLGYTPYNASNPSNYITSSALTPYLQSSVAATTYEPIISTKNTAFNVNFGTGLGNAAQGNDSRINNGQTAFGWGNHALAGYATQSSVDLKESLSNKVTNLTSPNNTTYPTSQAVSDALLNFNADANDFQGIGSPGDVFRIKLVSASKGGSGNAGSITGILKGNGTSPYTQAIASDFPVLNQNTTGSAASLLTARLLWNVSFNGTANITAKPTFPTPTTSTASINTPAGVAPTTPVNGDHWMTTLAEYHRINGVTKQVAYTSDLAQVVEVSGTSQTMVANTIYIPHNAGLTTFPLPASATVGQLFQIVGEGAGGWRISQATSQQIVGVNVATTAGTAGYIQSTNANCTITLRYTNTNKWTITSSQGTLTIN